MNTVLKERVWETGGFWMGIFLPNMFQTVVALGHHLRNAILNGAQPAKRNPFADFVWVHCGMVNLLGQREKRPWSAVGRLSMASWRADIHPQGEAALSMPNFESFSCEFAAMAAVAYVGQMRPAVL